MNTELESRLVTAFPRYFKDYRGDPMKTCMAWGCAHGDGWFGILWQLCKDIEAEEAKLPEEQRNFHFLQIKEKFGTLRLYCSCCTPEISKLVHKAEEMSELICEECGTDNTTVENKAIRGWYTTLCEKCRNERSL